MEAGGGDQHWARRLIEMSHDAADARAIWMATQMNSKAIAVKTEAQQDVLALHRMRQQLVKFRTMQLTTFVLPTEYGEVMARSRIALDKAVLGVLQRLPAVLIDTPCEQWRGLEDLDKQITEIERRLHAWMKQDEACKAIAAIPGVGGDCSSRDDG